MRTNRDQRLVALGGTTVQTGVGDVLVTRTEEKD